jgi:hypothetical protein
VVFSDLGHKSLVGKVLVRGLYNFSRVYVCLDIAFLNWAATVQ